MVIVTQDMIHQLQNLMESCDEQLKITFENLHQGCPSEMMIRFLKARDGNISKAHSMLVDCLNWRTENEIDEIVLKPITPAAFYRSVRDSQLIGMSGYTKDGRPVIAVGVGLSTYDKASGGDYTDKVHVSFDPAYGVTVKVKAEVEKHVLTTFLNESISKGREKGKKNVWLTLPSDFTNLHSVAVEAGFQLCEGSSTHHRFFYEDPQPNVSHIVDIKHSELYDIESAEFRSDRVWGLPEDPNVSDNRRACYMIPFTDKIGVQLYIVFLGATGVLLQSFNQAIESTLQERIYLAASFGSLMANFMIVVLVYTYKRNKPKNKWISFIFNLTGVMPLYIAYSMFLSERYRWVGIPTISAILAIVEAREEVQNILKGLFDKYVNAMKSLRNVSLKGVFWC